MGKYYAVAVGRKPGIYTDWPSCKEKVVGFVGAKYKSFLTKDEAVEWIKTKQAAPVRTPRTPRTPPPPASFTVFCDGSSINNGKKGAVASAGIVVWGKPEADIKHISIYAEMLPSTDEQTNQRAELYAAMRACDELGARKVASADIYTDSMYTINCLTKWTPTWIKNGWKKANGEPVLHADIIKPVHEWLQLNPGIHMRHISAHVDEKATEWPFIGNAVADWATHVARVGVASAPVASSEFEALVPALAKRLA